MQPLFFKQGAPFEELGTSRWRGGRDGDRLGDDRRREEYSQCESGQGPHDQLDSRMLGTVAHQR
ncbi:MAG TPA: hypothetical protein QF604_16630 [Candidatus Latescibacteria bacterium]|nr:hypothetical protein [Gemmatimonadota bacterium]MDP7362872.1 hypothetical protein [Candidatus Latescibacterota bacterium]HCV22196.1 hypothetical protein [Candidatus Latescibacterota bacterium]HJN29529.1 hypothetical protein [Candidatus Latescibacterota bacterium]